MRARVFPLLLSVILVLGLVLGSSGKAQAEPVEISLGYVTAVGQLTPLIYEVHKLGALKHYGKTYTVNSLHFKGTSPMIPAMAAGQLDIGYLAFSSFANAVLNAKLPVRLLSDHMQTGPKSGFAFTWYALEKSAIKSVPDLRGKNVAINVAGAGVDLMLRAALKKHGLDPAKDVNIVEVAFPNIEAMLREGKIDAGVLVSSFAMRALRRGGLHKVFAARDEIGGTQFVFPVVMESFLEKRLDVLADFLEDYLISLAWYRNPANRDKAIDLAAAFTKQPRKTLEDWAFKPEWDYYRDPNGEPNLEVLQKNINLLAEMKFIKESFDVKKYVDLRPLRKAQARFQALKK
ncbi:MAG: ABC transporter substrate-binding protein [Candidatus Tectomicrobia bacterium]|nr:ABC transporter substrate-binding protein [Candidatus Tectomicrobia bacterium]